MLGIQVFSALRDLYGRNGAETVSGLCGTRVVLAAPDQETARWSAESLGRGEVTEYAEGLSYGASAMRDGVSLTQRREMRPLALPSEIMRLENLHGYLKFPGPMARGPDQASLREKAQGRREFRGQGGCEPCRSFGASRSSLPCERARFRKRTRHRCPGAGGTGRGDGIRSGPDDTQRGIREAITDEIRKGRNGCGR